MHHWEHDSPRRGWTCMYITGFENSPRDTCGADTRVGCGAFVADRDMARFDPDNKHNERVVADMFDIFGTDWMR
jgi:hypothetical protein